MAERKFKPGDKVRLTEPPCDGDRLTLRGGDIGTVCKVDAVGVLVDWGRNINGHDGFDGLTPPGHAWWVSGSQLELVQPVEVHIKSDGRKTEAFVKKGNRGAAVCSKSDTFDFPTGAAIALARAYGIDPAELAQRIAKAVGGASAAAAEGEARKKIVLREGRTPYGTAGTPTKLKDHKGTPLYVGDVVDVKSASGNSYGEAFVVEWCGEKFVMGIEIGCRNDGSIDPLWKVTWKRSWKELSGGETRHGIRACVVKEEEA